MERERKRRGNKRKKRKEEKKEEEKEGSKEVTSQEKKKKRVTQYTNTPVEGRGNILQESVFVRHPHFTDRKQEDYNILKEKDHNILFVACVHAALKGPH